MNSSARKYERKSFRLPEYDYSQNGAYFVTILSHRRKHLFGEIENDEIELNAIGKIVQDTWFEISDHFPHAKSDFFVVMPNHIHGIIMIDGTGATHASPLRSISVTSIANDQVGSRPKGPASGSLGAIIGSFKSAATKRIRQIDGNQTIHVWHRNYHEHLIRDEKALQRIVEYIDANPENWANDPINLPVDEKIKR